jgi:hypothetical protein
MPWPSSGSRRRHRTSRCSCPRPARTRRRCRSRRRTVRCGPRARNARWYAPTRRSGSTRQARRWSSSSYCTVSGRPRSGPSARRRGTSSRSPDRAAGSPSTRRSGTGGSPPTRARSRPWPRFWRRCRPRPPPTCTSRSRTPPTRSRSTARRRPRSPGITGGHRTRSAPNWPRRRAPPRFPPGHGSGWPARLPRCGASGGTSPASAAFRRVPW